MSTANNYLENTVDTLKAELHAVSQRLVVSEVQLEHLLEARRFWTDVRNQLFAMAVVVSIVYLILVVKAYIFH